MSTRIAIVFCLSILCIDLRSQQGRGMCGFPELVNSKIPGAPILGQPVLIEGHSGPVMAEGFGLAAPAFFDMNDDGLKDLLIGEFASGVEYQRHISTGSFVRVYKNEGTESNPVFSGHFYYAHPPFEYEALGNGTPYSVDQDCCIGFTPQFTDLNKDGYPDMITGQYEGEVSWFEGTEKGFLPGKQLPQDGNPRKRTPGVSRYYWFYSSASFGDFTGDGLDDLITGGMSLRISRNIGTKETPSFGKRELLLDTEGTPLQVYQYQSDDKEFKLLKLTGTEIPQAGNPKLSPYVVDWDDDGMLDLLVTNSYSHAGLSIIDFFKGVKNRNGMYRFEKAKPLFVAKDGTKEFPGSGPRVFVTDYNNDGINDLLIGASIALMNGKFSDRLAWSWESDLELYGAGRDPRFLFLSGDRLKNYRGTTNIPPGIAFDDFITIGHVGYVYVMLGLRE